MTEPAEESSAKSVGVDSRFGEVVESSCRVGGQGKLNISSSCCLTMFLAQDAARVLLTRAVEDGCCPLSVDLWLALARLEEYQEVMTMTMILMHEKFSCLTADHRQGRC